MRVLWSRLPPGGARRWRQGRLDQPRARWARQRGAHVPQGPLRPPVLEAARPFDDATDPRGRRRPAAGKLGRGDRADRLGAGADQGRARSERDRRPRLLAGHERGLLRDVAPDARRDRDQQHRQLLTRLSFAHVVRDAQVARALGGDGLLSRLRPCRRDSHHRSKPDRGSSGRRRADQAGRPAGHAASDDRPAADRARRVRGLAPRAASGDQRRRDARAGPCDRARRLLRSRVHRGAHGGVRRGPGAAPVLFARGRRGDQRGARRGPRGGGAHLRGGRERVLLAGASASPSTSTAPRSSG